MVKEVFDNIYMFEAKLPKSPLKAINVYVIKDKDKNLVLDTGYNMEETLLSMKEGLKELDLDIKDTELFLTHMHADHTGLSYEFSKEGCPVYIGKVDGDLVVDSIEGSYWKFVEKLFEYYAVKKGEVVLDDHPGYLYQPDDKADFIFLEEGATIKTGDYEFEAISIKGHTPGHMGLYEKNHKILFCGDTILETITPNITFWGFDKGDMLGVYINTLLDLKKMDIEYVFSTHRELIKEYRSRIDTIIYHHMLRMQEILDAMESGIEYTIRDLAPRISWRIKADGWDDFPPAQKFFASGETMAHVYHLVEKGYIIMEERQGVLYFKKNFLTLKNSSL